MNKCPSRAELEALLAEHPAGETEQPIVTHIDQCPSCQQVLEELTALKGPSPAPAGQPPGPGPESPPTWSSPPRPAAPAGRPPGPAEDPLNRLRPLLPPTPDTLDYVQPAGGASGGFPLIPGYEILGELGRGGMGVVYQARQVRADRLVALKMILAGDEADPGQLERFQDEARAVARLRHPHIVQIYEVGEHDGRLFFSLELAEGGSLARRLTGKPWPARQAAALVAAVAGAVQHAHDQGVLHRDLKPGNILLAADGTPKVTDFGLAKILGRADPLTEPGAVLGTPAFMAPEQANGFGSAVGPGSDVFALGAILYVLLTGKLLYQGSNLMETLRQAGAGTITPPRQHNPNVPAGLDRICRKALEKEPARRYAAAADLERDLLRFLDRPRRQRRAFLVGGVGLLAAAAGGTLLAHFLGGEKESPPALQDDRLVVRVWSKDGSKKGLRLGVDPGALPVQPGDKLRIEVRLNRPAHIYLLFLGAQGEVTPLYPWHQNTRVLDKTLADPPPVLPPRATLFWPSRESSKGLPLDENSGLETILLLARDQPIRDPQLLARLIGPLPLPPAPLGEEEEFAVRGGGKGEAEGIRFDQNRGIAKRLEQIDEPLEKMLGRLEKEFALSRAVRFAHKGR